jgi:hypothetical protein
MTTEVRKEGRGLKKRALLDVQSVRWSGGRVSAKRTKARHWEVEGQGCPTSTTSIESMLRAEG